MTTPAANGRLDDGPLTLPERPLVSIVIPCLNEERYIVALLDSLAAQDYGRDGIEVIVADGGSTGALIVGRKRRARARRVPLVGHVKGPDRRAATPGWAKGDDRAASRHARAVLPAAGAEGEEKAAGDGAGIAVAPAIPPRTRSAPMMPADRAPSLADTRGRGNESRP